MSASVNTEKQDFLIGVKHAMGRMREYCSRRSALVVLALMALAVGLVAGWPWLVAAGVAPILLALAPCAVMCGLGLCMSKMSGRKCSTAPDAKAASKGKSD